METVGEDVDPKWTREAVATVESTPDRGPLRMGMGMDMGPPVDHLCPEGRHLGCYRAGYLVGRYQPPVLEALLVLELLCLSWNLGRGGGLCITLRSGWSGMGVRMRWLGIRVLSRLGPCACDHEV